MYPVGSYCTDISLWTVNKTLKLSKFINYFSEGRGFKRGDDCSGWNSSWFFLRLFRFWVSTSYRDSSCSASYPRIYSASRRKTVWAIDFRLIPWSRVLEKQIDSQLVKKSPAFYGTRRFTTAFTVPAICPYPEPDQSNPSRQPTRGVHPVWWFCAVLTSHHKMLPSYETFISYWQCH